MGKSLANALQMANLCYDRRRELGILEAIKSLTTWRELTPLEQASLIQPYNLRDPRLVEVKEWVLELSIEKNVKGKYD